MRFFSISRIIHLCITLAIANCFFLTGMASHAADPVKMQIDSPYGVGANPLTLQVKTGRWFPVAVTLINKGEEVSGRVQMDLVSQGGSSERDASFYSDISLPTNSNKRVWIYGRGEGAELDHAVITFSARGIKTLRADVDLKTIEPYQRLVYTVSDSGERLGFLGGLRDRKLGDAKALREIEQMENYGGNSQKTRRQFLRPVASFSKMLPDRSLGLEAVDVLFLRDWSEGSLTPQQLNALRNYVAMGGTLIVPGGADWQRLNSSSLSPLWPVEATGSGVASTDETAAIVRRYVGTKDLSGADRLGGAPVVLLRGNLRPEAAWLDKDGTSTIGIRDYGAGRVMVMNIDPSVPPFVGWDGQAALWSEVMQNLPSSSRLDSVGEGGSLDPNDPSYAYYDYEQQRQDNSTVSLLRVIRKLPQLQTPPTSAIAWFLAVYVFCLVPLNYFVLRGMDKREWAWVTIPVIAVAFSLMSYFAARRIKGTDLLARHINIVQSSGTSGVARADTMLWIYSPRRTYYTISSPDKNMTFADFVPGGFNAPPSSLDLNQPATEASFRMENVPVKMWDEAQFIGQSTLDVGNGVRLVKSGNVIKIANNTGAILRGAILVSRNSLWKCGDMKAGATISPQLSRTRSSRDEAETLIVRLSNLDKIYPSAKVRPGKVGHADSTLRQLAYTALKSSQIFNTSQNENILIGWGTQPVSALQVEGETPRQQNVTLYVFRLPNTPIL